MDHNNFQIQEQPSEELDVGRYLTVIFHWWRLILLCAVLGALAAFGVSSLLSRSYEAEATLAIIRTGTLFNYDSKIQTVSDTDPRAPNVDQTALRKSLVTIAESGDFAQQVINRMGSQLPAPLRNPAVLAQVMRITNDGNLIRIRASAETGDQAALLANTSAQEFENRMNALYSESPVSPEMARAQADAAKQEYQVHQSALVAFLKDNSLEELTRQRDMVANQLDNQVKLENKLVQLESEAGALRQRMASDTASGSRGNELATLLLEASAFSTGAELPVNLQVALDQVNSDANSNDQVKQLDSLIVALQGRRLALHDDTQRTLYLELDSLKAQIEQANAKQRELTAARDLAWTTYQSLATQVAQSDVAAQAEGQIVRLATPAIVPLEPAPSGRPISTLLGGVVGLLVGVALAFVMEFFGSGFNDPEQVSRALELPTLAVLPHLPVTAQGPNLAAAAAEPLRGLRYFLLSEPERRVVTTASPNPDEGSSALATQLAVIASQAGKKILLVDANLRKPTQQSAFRFERTIGLSDLLRGSSADPTVWTTYVKPSGFDGLVLMPAGTSVDDPAALLESETFLVLVGLLKSSFDLVIIDAPAVLSVVDAVIVSHASDGVLLVLDSINTSVKDAMHAKQRLAPHATILGVVLNQTASSNVRPEDSDSQTSSATRHSFSAGMRLWFVRLLGPRPG